MRGYAPLLAHRFATPLAGDILLRNLPSERSAFCGAFSRPTGEPAYRFFRVSVEIPSVRVCRRWLDMDSD